MVRKLTSNALNEVNKQFGTEPSIVIKIDNQFYSETPISFAKNNIIMASEISSQKKNYNVGMVSNMSFTLDDTDGSLKTWIDTTIIENKDCVVFQYYKGLNEDDMFVLFKGKIVGPITWDEGKRTLDFDVETLIEDKEIGYAPEEGDFVGLSNDSIGVTWPLCFGNPIHVPVVQVSNRATTTLKFPYQSKFHNADAPYFDVVDSSEFPTGLITVQIGKLFFRGEFSENRFNVLEPNVPKYINIVPRPRISGTQETITIENGEEIRKPAEGWEYLDDIYKSRVFWLEKYIDIVGYRVVVIDEWGNERSNRVISQSGLKVYLAHRFTNTGGGDILLGDQDNIKEIIFTKNSKSISRSINPRTGDTLEERVVLDVTTAWGFGRGSVVTEWSTDPYVYICNSIPSNSIKSVYAKKTINDVEEFVAVPTLYYTKDLNYKLGDRYCTVLLLNVPIENLESQNWGNKLYVTLESSIGNNTADQLKWALDTYSELTTDEDSFSQVATKLMNYPSNFALFDVTDVLSFCEEVAWQARCGLVINSGIVEIVYLSEQPNNVMTINETNTEFKSVKIESTSVLDLVTRLTGTWQKDYFEEKREINYSNNIDIFGLKKDTKDFWIYNTKSLVEKSLNFWGYRGSNSWKDVDLTVPLTGSKLEIFDGVDLSFSLLVTDPVRSVLDTFSYSNNKINLKFNTPIQLGTTIVDPNFWLDDSGDVLPFDPSTNFSETVFISKTILNNPVFKINKRSYPAIVTGFVARGDYSNGKYIIDAYENGYTDSNDVDNDPTRVDLIADPVESTETFEVGDKVIATEAGKIYIVSAKVNANLEMVKVAEIPPSGRGKYTGNLVSTDITDDVLVITETAVPYEFYNILETNGQKTYLVIGDIVEINRTNGICR